MNIAILGAGRVGTTLGARFANAGHDVTYGVRHPDDPKHAGLSSTRQRVASLADAAAAADVSILTTSWAGAQDALASAGNLSGKILVDATNPIGPGMVLTHGTTDSGAEQVSRWVPGANVVKAFNSIGMEVMADPTFGDARAVLFMCGDDKTATTTVAQLATDIGFDPLVIGSLTRARFIEPAALVWITASMALGSRQFAWGRLTR